MGNNTKSVISETKLFTLFLLLILLNPGLMFSGHAQHNLVEIKIDHPGIPVPETMFGIFFEDINFAADGGIYAELIKNRSFEFDPPIMGWEPFGSVTISNDKPCFRNNPHYARLSFQDELSGTGLDNNGFKGLPVKIWDKYTLNFYSRNLSDSNMIVQVQILGSQGEILSRQDVRISSKTWSKYEVNLTPTRTTANGRFRMLLISKGEIDIDHISLFPEKTYNNRPNGLRSDLVDALKDLKPGIMRFPGGCVVEGTTLDTRYQWKNTIGPVEERPVMINRWNYIVNDRRFPDYYQSFGLGFYEYFLLCEDIGAEPLPVVNCGLTCQWVNKDETHHCRVDELQPYIQDALDLIEFANGDINSTWGKIRSELGHPAPFNLKFLAVGNEQWGEQYSVRASPFIDSIRYYYPEIQIVGSSGPFPSGPEFDFGWKEMRRLGVDLVDEHYYRDPQWFLNNASRYDSYSRSGPKVFAGEYACHAAAAANSFEAALCEAAFLTGIERNADVVTMSSYAPLFAHVDNWQWKPNLIWFDNLNVIRTPSYYVQQLFSTNKGTHVIPYEKKGMESFAQDSLYLSVVKDVAKGKVIIKVVNVGMKKQILEFSLVGLPPSNFSVKLTQLHHENSSMENTLNQPDEVIPVFDNLNIQSNSFKIEIGAKSFNVLEI
jgi:alpha-L-arabinofuranosidase